ncbi:hypothetical protein BH10PSE12_BH10PSE12_34450 [soil metagenome]
MPDHETEIVSTPPISAPVSAQSPAPPPAAPDKAAPSADAQPTSGNKGVWMGTAVGVGSAALVAALLYAKRRK